MAKCKSCKQEVKSVVPKMKWVDKEDGENENTTYRITFDCYPEDFQAIEDEIIAYGQIFKEEKEVVDNA